MVGQLCRAQRTCVPFDVGARPIGRVSSATRSHDRAASGQAYMRSASLAATWVHWSSAFDVTPAAAQWTASSAAPNSRILRGGFTSVRGPSCPGAGIGPATRLQGRGDRRVHRRQLTGQQGGAERFGEQHVSQVECVAPCWFGDALGEK